MILAIDSDQCLSVYSNPDDVAHHIDDHFIVEGGEFRFFDETGQELAGEVIRPAGFRKKSIYAFRPLGSPNKPLLLSLVSQARVVDGWLKPRLSKEFPTVNDLKAFLVKSP